MIKIIKHVDGVTNVRAKGMEINGEFIGEYRYEGMDYGVTLPLAAKTAPHTPGSASLIAAAPEMLEALEMVVILKHLIQYPDNTKEEHQGEAEAVSTLINRIESVIAKAKGIYE